MGGGVGESQCEFAVGSEFDDPAVVVDVGVMVAADGDEVTHTLLIYPDVEAVCCRDLCPHFLRP